MTPLSKLHSETTGSLSARVGEPQRVVQAICVPVEVLRVVGALDEVVGREERDICGS